MSLRSFLGAPGKPRVSPRVSEKQRFYQSRKKIKSKQKTRCIDTDLAFALVNYVDRHREKNLPNDSQIGWGIGSAQFVKSYISIISRRDNTLSSTDLGDFLSRMRHRNTSKNIHVLLTLIRRSARDYR